MASGEADPQMFKNAASASAAALASGGAGIMTFANRFPVYFRAPFLLALVWTLWGVNVYVFKSVGIPYAELLNLDPNSTLTPKQIISSGLAFLAGIGLLVVAFMNQWPFRDVLLFPSLLYMGLMFALLTPANILHRAGREHLLHNISRVFFPAATGVLFVEVLLGDILTSISKVLADIEVTGCVMAAHLITPPGTHSSAEGDSHGGAASVSTAAMDYSRHERQCADSWMRPLVTSLPFLIRFRQCWVMYTVTGKAFPHLLNCVKYASSLPVIWIAAFAQAEGHFSREMRIAWILSISVSSCFSFLWDTVMDWGLCREGGGVNGSGPYFLLREPLLYSFGGMLGYRTSSSSLSYDDEEDSAEAADRYVDAAAASRPPEAGGSRLQAAWRRLVALDFGGPKVIREPTSPERRGGGGAAASMKAPSVVDASSPPPTPNHYPVTMMMGSGPGPVYVIYYCAIAGNFFLRVLWSFNISSSLALSNEGLYFVLEVAEICRRFIWILFRVEWEAIEKRTVATQAMQAFASYPPADLNPIELMAGKKSPRESNLAPSNRLIGANVSMRAPPEGMRKFIHFASGPVGPAAADAPAGPASALGEARKRENAANSQQAQQQQQ